MNIFEVTENKKKYLSLLLEADEQEDMIDRYLDKGRMYLLDDDGVKCECVVTVRLRCRFMKNAVLCVRTV